MKPTGGYGRIFESMYAGSMVGAGLAVFALWPYVISHMRGHVEYGALIELNPELLGFVLGCQPKEIEGAIKYLEAPDERSRTPVEEGRRLVRLGRFLYRVVNGGEYLRIRKAEANRQMHREAQQRYLSRKRGKGAGGVNFQGKEPLAAALDKAGDVEGSLRAEEMAAGVAPGALGGLGESNIPQRDRDYAADLSERLPGVPPDLDPPTEDDLPDPDAPAPFPEV